jgi:selenocysteine-specific elongation factor
VGIGDSVRLLPGGQTGRIRSIECYGAESARTDPGTRTAIGIAGIERDHAGRGDVVVGANDPWQVTDGFDAEIDLLASALRPLNPRSRVRVHVGTAELIARVYPRGAIAPGSRGLARVALEGPTVGRGGDRIVLRAYSPVTTIGGGWIVDPVAPGRAAWPAALTDPEPAPRLAALGARRRRGLALASVPVLVGVPPSRVESLLPEAGTVTLGGTLFSRAVVESLERRVLDAIAAHHAAARDDDGLSLETARRAIPGGAKQADDVLARLSTSGRVRIRGDLVALPDFVPVLEGGADAVDALVARIAGARLEPPTLGELADEMRIASIGPIVKRAVADGRLVLVERDRYFAAAEVDRFVATLVELGQAGPIAPKDVRERLGLTRKFMIPLFEWADRRGVTRREGDVRVLVDSDR